MNPAASQDVLLSAMPKGEVPVAYLSFNRNGYSTYCRVFWEYQELIVGILPQIPRGARNDTFFVGLAAYRVEWRPTL